MRGEGSADCTSEHNENDVLTLLEPKLVRQIDQNILNLLLRQRDVRFLAPSGLQRMHTRPYQHRDGRTVKGKIKHTYGSRPR